ncbi:MAG TPA: hypothetical protein DCF68_17205 [Cyanothece sp. UBA12306]|nr:hypothetical protein [Cyanothece sp. UBA12306]
MLSNFVRHKSIYSQIPCSEGNPLNCAKLKRQSLDDPQLSQCQVCNFPSVIPPQTEIQGKEGRYVVNNWVGSRGIGRIYQGSYLIDQQDVIIKEYLFPSVEFQTSKIQSRQKNLKQFSNLQLINGQKPDFRILLPKETIIDSEKQRCYTVTNVGVKAIPLKDYLTKYGKMEEETVWKILDQVLQSLSLLHCQKFRFPSGLTQSGLAHGNLSLENLLILPENQGFLIYLADLALWERFAQPLPIQNFNQFCSPQVREKDLSSLGYIGFYLLAGISINDEGMPLNPYDNQYWNNPTDVLKNYLFNLMGLATLSFKTAETARKELLRIQPQLIPTISATTLLPLSKSIYVTPRRWWWIGGGILGFIVLSLLLYWLSTKTKSFQSNFLQLSKEKIAEISDIPPGQFEYGSLINSSWNYTYTQKNLVIFNKSFEKLIQEQQANLKNWKYKASSLSTVSSNFDFLVKDVINGKLFFIGNTVKPLSTQYNTLPFAYDAIAIFVAFNYAQRQKGLPYALKGKITLEQVQKIYSGEVTNWKDLDDNFPDLLIQFYVPNNPEVEAIFKEKVLKYPDIITKYESFIEKLTKKKDNGILNNSCVSVNKPITIYKRLIYGKGGILQCIIQDFENNNPSIGSIGFASLSKIVSQCSVYPLAISSQFNSSVSPLILKNDKAITPETNLCNHKGSYKVNTEAIRSQTYPLSYPLSVIYFRDNRRRLVGDKFAEILRTKEGQCLLKKVQITPINSVDCSQY